LNAKPGLSKPTAQLRGRKNLALARAEEKNVDPILLGKHQLESLKLEVLRAGNMPGIDAARQAKKRAAMAHVGETEPAVAICINGRLIGISCNALRHPAAPEGI